MAVKSEIVDGHLGTRVGAAVTSRGQLVTAPLAYNVPIYRSMTVANQAYNFVEPIAGKQFVISGIIFSSDKNVSSTNGAAITIYGSDAPDSLIPVLNGTVFRLDIGRLETTSETILNVITQPGIWINAFTDDATTNLTILGYYVDAE